jgi:hypothetical protein
MATSLPAASGIRIAAGDEIRAWKTLDENIRCLQQFEQAVNDFFLERRRIAVVRQ